MKDEYDDRLLFSMDYLEAYKRGAQSKASFAERIKILVARSHALNDRLRELQSTAPPAVVASLKKPL